MTVEERLAVLEQRLRRAEDELAIARLMASYGPLADAGEADAVAGLWTEDGEYDVDGWHMRSRADMAEMVRSPAHQGLIGGGSAHFLGPVHIDVAGDEAVAVCESILVRHNEDGSGYAVAAFADAMNPMGRIGDPYLDIAPVALFLAGEGCRYLTGNTLFVDGGSHINGVAWTPDLDAAP
jgi:hypothetical protein